MTSYILPNRVGYIDYVQNKFHPDKITKYKETKNSKSFEHQILIDKYLNINSPYRGLLLYHELGTGKTATSITLVNQYLKTKKKIYVILPASLRNNYIKELLLYSDFKFYKFKNKWTFDSKGIPTLSDTGILHKDADKNEKLEIENAIKRLILARITFINYNGLTDTKISSLSGRINTKKFTEYLENLKWKRVYGIGKQQIKELYGIDVSGNFYKDTDKEKYVLLPDILKTALTVKDSLDTDKENIEKIIKIIIDNNQLFIKTLNIKDIKILDSVFSDSLVIIDEAHSFIRTVSNKSKLATPLYQYIMDAKRCKILLLSGTPIINNPYEVLHLCNLLRGPITTYSFPGKPDIKKYEKYIDTINYNNNKTIIQLVPENFVKTSDNFVYYEQWKTPDLINKITDKKHKTITDYAFPPDDELFKKYFYNYNNGEHIGYVNTDIFKRRIMGLVSFVDKTGTDFPSESGLIVKYVYLSNPQFKQLLDKLIIEAKIDEANKKKKQMKKTNEESSVYKTYSRAVSNFSFPEGIIRDFPSDFKKMITTYEEEKDYDGENDYDKHLKDIKNRFIKKVNDITDINEQHTLLQTCSAKYMEIIKDINTTNGKILIYSQFRTLEGVGMLSVYLDLLGFGKVEYNKGSFDIPESNPNNYMIYSLDKDIANEQIKLFNSTDNLRGERIKILIITLSGAEGISLKNVRAVMMLEPHWNMTVLKQVIGRAVRNGSHLSLPEDERNVKTFLYLTEATAEQKANNETFRIQHNSKTTDQVIFEKSELKQKNIDMLLALMKESAFDCNIHAKKNGIDCYKWAYNLDKSLEAYKPSLTDEFTHMLHKNYEKEKYIKGTVEIIDSIKVVNYDGKYYDYDAYVNSKQLIPYDADIYTSEFINKKPIIDVVKPISPTDPISPIKSKSPPKKDPISPIKPKSPLIEDPISPIKSVSPHKDPISPIKSKSPPKDPISPIKSKSPPKDPISPIKSKSPLIEDPISPKKPKPKTKKVIKPITPEKSSSSSAISDDFKVDIDQNNKLLDPTYNTKYKIVDALGDGSCFYRAIYLVLKNNKKIMEFIKCFSLRSGLKENIKEDEFVKWLRIKILAAKTLSGKDNDISKNTYNTLKALPPKEYKTFIDSSWNTQSLKTIPKTLKDFRTIVSEYIGDISKYANQYDKELIESLCDDKFKIRSLQYLPELDYNFQQNDIYILRINNNHYQAILISAI